MEWRYGTRAIISVIASRVTCGPFTSLFSVQMFDMNRLLCRVHYGQNFSQVLIFFLLTLFISYQLFVNWVLHKYDGEVTWASWCLKSLVIWLFDKQLVQAHNNDKKIIKTHLCHLWGQSTSNGSPHKGPVMWRAFHRMTSCLSLPGFSAYLSSYLAPR